MENKIAVFVLNWNSVNDTIGCIDSVLKSDYKDYDVYILDNGSSLDEYSILKEKYKNFKNIYLLKSSNNLGFSGGNNHVLKNINPRIRYQYFFLLNNDTVIDKKMLGILVKSAISIKEEWALIVPKIYYYDEKRQKNKIWSPGFHFSKIRGTTEIKYTFPVGCAFFIKGEYVNKYGLLNNNYFAYNEDNEFVYKLRKNNKKVFYESTAEMWHKVVEHRDSPFKAYMNARNKWVFLRNMILFDNLFYILYLLSVFIPVRIIKYLIFPETEIAFLKGLSHGVYFFLTGNKKENPFVKNEHLLDFDANIDTALGNYINDKNINS